ncbi:hypothetical protein EBR78_10705 [bacterium]|nr:hypothetical protein [bacterium]
MQPVPYFDPKILSFLKENIRELEKKVEAVIVECQYQVLNRERLAQKAQQNQALVETFVKKAEQSADQTFERLAREAAKKARTP